MRQIDIDLRELVSRGHAVGRNMYSETDSSRKKNNYVELAQSSLVMIEVKTDLEPGAEQKSNSSVIWVSQIGMALPSGGETRARQ